MKENTSLPVDVKVLPEFLRELGTQVRFISLVTETEVEMRKTGNPFVGTVWSMSITRNVPNVE
jgi:hypothetical protein